MSAVSTHGQRDGEARELDLAHEVLAVDDASGPPPPVASLKNEYRTIAEQQRDGVEAARRRRRFNTVLNTT